MTERLLSSRWTFAIKYVFPIVWIPLFGFGVLALLTTPGGGSDGAELPAAARATLLGAWLLGSAVVLWALTPLKRVKQSGAALIVSNYRREVRVPLAAVEDVRQNRWLNWRPIHVRLNADFGMGTTFTFMPPSRIRFRIWREDPEVLELRSAVGVARAGS